MAEPPVPPHPSRTPRLKIAVSSSGATGMTVSPAADAGTTNAAGGNLHGKKKSFGNVRRRLSTVKRRMSQAVRERVGKSSTHTDALADDEEYDALHTSLLSYDKEAHRLGRTLGGFAQSLKQWTSTGMSLSAAFCQTMDVGVDGDDDDDDAAHVASLHLSHTTIDDDVRRHVTKVFIEHVLGPLQELVTKTLPDVKRRHKKKAWVCHRHRIVHPATPQCPGQTETRAR